MPGTFEPAWAAVILAAGASRRMGQPKQLLPASPGAPLVARTAATALAAGFWPVVVVVGAHSDVIKPVLARLPVLLADNAAWMEGMASSLRAGIGVVSQFSRAVPGALIALCDQPGFSAEAADRLRAAAVRTGAAAAHYEGHLGAPACFSRRHFPALSALTGEQGARAWLQTHADQVEAVDLPELAVDLDTPADYAAFLAGSPAINAVRPELG